MNTTLTARQTQLFGVLAVLIVAIGGYLVMTHKSSTSTTTPAVTAPAKSTPAQTTATPSTAHSHTATPATLDTHGLPVPVARALQKHAVVVVSVTDPRGTGDQVDRAEAQAGAASAGAAYVSIDVFHQKSGTAILRKLGIVDTPAILVVTRPGTIDSEFKGFVDRAVVSQAVTDAR
ncbi:MAG TPA: hypothetical protein VGH46_07130 [Gaiellaceae bacterium]|jgi:hypothetical protein